MHVLLQIWCLCSQTACVCDRLLTWFLIKFNATLLRCVACARPGLPFSLFLPHTHTSTAFFHPALSTDSKQITAATISVDITDEGEKSGRKNKLVSA